ncbi:hypothetical protein SAY87_025952 [Trapa incisa]|uniref:Uncharacterized protein n=1 Tax=Trapa incisa TaxID=236973 RepID=A0AAN7GIQ8_9MYRT|nr:hypothetical protein SAY87_025952 [Trapa incisa]
MGTRGSYRRKASFSHLISNSSSPSSRGGKPFASAKIGINQVMIKDTSRLLHPPIRMNSFDLQAFAADLVNKRTVPLNAGEPIFSRWVGSPIVYQVMASCTTGQGGVPMPCPARAHSGMEDMELHVFNKHQYYILNNGNGSTHTPGYAPHHVKESFISK